MLVASLSGVYCSITQMHRMVHWWNQSIGAYMIVNGKMNNISFTTSLRPRRTYKLRWFVQLQSSLCEKAKLITE